MAKKKSKHKKKSLKNTKQKKELKSLNFNDPKINKSKEKSSPKKTKSKAELKSKNPTKTKKVDKEKIILSNNKIKLEKFDHSYSNVINNRYGSKAKKIFRPISFLIKLIITFALLIALFLTTLFVVFGQDLPDVKALKDINFSETTVIYDREGNILYKIFSEENRKYVPLSQISDDIINGTLAIEDKNFYKHFGFDISGMVRAQLKNLKEEDIKQGASTVTQQLAKNIFLSPERTYERKIKEFLISLQIESMFDKDEILELYLNKIPYGSNAYGVEAASKTFFGKSASELSLAESAVLASLPKAPSYFSPYGQNKKELLGYCKTSDNEEDNLDTLDDEEILNPDEEHVFNEEDNFSGPLTPDFISCKSPDDPNYVIGRKDLVLTRMVEDGYITEEEKLQAWKESFDLNFQNPAHKIEAPHFIFYVKEFLEQKYGKELVENGGLEVVTTLDPKLQSLAEEIIATNAPINKSRHGANNAAMVSLDVRTGQILSMVGSVNYWDSSIDGQVNVATSLRQPGSAFKPLVYASAIQNGGIGSGTILSDSKTTFENNYTPKNSDNAFKGKISVRSALGQSRNIPAIKALYIAGGEEKVLDFMDSIGVTSLRKFKNEFNESSEERGWTFHYGPALAIGSGEISLLELVSGFSTLGNGGKYMGVNPILEVRDRNGKIIDSFEPNGIQVMDPQVAYILNNILADAYARPAGSWRNTLTIFGHTVASKTGTSNKKIGRINYPNNLLTAGYSPSIAAGFWTGNTNGDRLSYNAWGLTASAPMWKEFMTTVLADKPDESFHVPDGLIWRGREVYPSFLNNTDYDKMFKSEIKDDEEDEEEENIESAVETDDLGVPLDTFVGEKIKDPPNYNYSDPDGSSDWILNDYIAPNDKSTAGEKGDDTVGGSSGGAIVDEASGEKGNSNDFQNELPDVFIEKPDSNNSNSNENKSDSIINFTDLPPDVDYGF